MNEDTELKTMTAVAAALDQVKDEAVMGRVLDWVNSRYGKARPSSPGRQERVEREPEEAAEHLDVASLFAAARPNTDADKALVVAYWYQVHEARANLDAQEINSALKNLGHRSSNITAAFNALKARKPALAMQVQKKGTSQQARKQYRLTTAGVDAVKQMLRGEEPNGD